eukprot:CAMPEP_0179494602 /NCGR_PEP_ID=MMETSP0799-20121207/68263_1 /TAXON_ID=46947 /ORGANISM="Geminigera cryophila, Strain CCMP2564" /LENGTH=55 /DNA_ID=CAMNT_0021312239 /DNA_START=287 /DNA_END=451 /DNA_ORIENTATION=+
MRFHLLGAQFRRYDVARHRSASTISTRDGSSYNRSVWVADGMGTLVSEDDPSGML